VTKAFLIYSWDQYNEVAGFAHNPNCIGENYLVHQELEKSGVKYLFENVAFSGNHDAIASIWHLALNWYRNEQGRDISRVEHLSIGQTLTRRAVFAFCNDYRNYLALKYWLEKYETIQIPETASESIHRVSRILNGQVAFYKASAPSAFYIPSSPERAQFREIPNVHRLSSLARALQKGAWLFHKKKSILYLNDWASKKAASERGDTMIGNSFVPWKGHYFNFDKRAFHSIKSLLPQEIDPAFASIGHLESVMERKGVKWEPGVLNLFVNIVKTEYALFRDTICRTYAIYKEWLEHYRPEFLILPGETDFANVIAANIAKGMGIRTLLLIDGYQLVRDDFAFFRDPDGKEFLFDGYFGQGKAYCDLLVSQDIPQNRIMLISPSILKNHSGKNGLTPPLYDAMIMAYASNLHNVHTLWDQQIKVETDLLYQLMKMNYKNIAIKVKPGTVLHMRQQARSVELYKKLLKDNYAVELTCNLHIVDDSFHEVVRDAKLVIGQISTAVLEAFAQDIPYYIYEPFEIGSSDLMIGSSKLFHSSSVARNLGQLKGMLDKKVASVYASKDYVLSGPPLSQVAIR